MIPSLVPLTNRLRRRLAAAVAVAVTAVLPLAAPTAPTAQAADGSVRTADAAGGYWMVASDGGIFSFGQAPFYGSTGNVKLNQPIVGMAATPTGKGYWFVASDGGIFSFGDAKFYGSTGDVKLNKPIVGMASTPTGKGYWFVASDGGIFSFGDASFFGSTGNVKLAKPITAMAASPSGKGYWFTASDGGVFNFGDAKFFGAGPSTPVPAGGRNVNAMIPMPDGSGYWMASATGELLAFGGAANLGGLTGSALAKPIVGMTAAPLAAAGPNPTVPGGGSTTTTGPTTGTTLPPYTGPMRFSSTALHSWGTPGDPAKSRISNTATTEAACQNVDGVWENGQCRVFPYAEKVADIVEIGNRVYIGGSFKNLHQNNHPKTPTMASPPMDYVAELDTDGNAVPGSAFNTRVSFDGPVRTLERSPDGRRLYVGGEFNKVNGEPHPQLVALDPATGEIDRSFNLSGSKPNRYVSSIVQHGSLVYIGGAFTQIGSTPRHGVAALNLDGSVTNFAPPPRYQGRLYGQTATPQENPPAEDLYGSVESLLVTRMGRFLLVGGTFLKFGYDYTADPNHLHAGLIALDPATGALAAWQPSQSSSDSKRRPAFGMANYNGNPRDIGINGDELFFAATGGSGGRVIAWVAGSSNPKPLWRGGVDGDAMAVAVTHDRVYLVGHFDHAVVDPNDDCLKYGPLPNGGNGVLCDQETPRRHLVAWDVRGEIGSDGKNTGMAVLDPSFTAQANTSEGPYTIHLGANRMYVGGNFTEVASSPVGTGGMAVKQAGFAAYPPLQ